MFNRLNVLKEKGYIPDIILDIGANVGEWTRSMLNIYKDSRYILFEANEYRDEFSKLVENPNITIHNVVLNERNEKIDFYSIKGTGDSFCKELTYHYKDCKAEKRNSVSLNHIFKNGHYNLENKKIFIKIDCQGAEIPILKGAVDILDKVDFILLEIPLFGKYNLNTVSFIDHIKYMELIGFIPYDIVDNHYINGFNIQVDMLFISKKHFLNNIVEKSLNVRPYIM